MTALEQENLIRHYLLGELSPSERERVEEQLFADEEFLSQVEAVEDELMDEYLAGTLGMTEKNAFEQNFVLTPERRERFQFASALPRALLEARPASRSASTVAQPGGGRTAWWAGLSLRPLQAAFATLILFVFAGALLWFGPFRDQQQVAVTPPQAPAPTLTAPSENPPSNSSVDNHGSQPSNGNRQSNEPNTNQLADNGGPTKPKYVSRKSNPGEDRAGLFAVVLASGALRSEGAGLTQFSVPAKGVRLQLLLDDGGEQEASLEAELQNADGQKLFGVRKLKARSDAKGNLFVVFTVPKSQLPAGDYQILLQSGGPDGAAGRTMYYFRVTAASRQE